MDKRVINNNFLHSHSLFGGLTDSELEEIRSHFREEHFRPGEIILHENEPNSKLYFIVEGTVSILKNCPAAAGADSGMDICQEAEAVITPAGEPVVLNTMNTGDTFGEMELIDIQPCAATVRADTPTIVCTFTNADLYQLSKWNLKTYAMIIMNLAREISRRLRANNELLSLDLYTRSRQN